MENTNTNLSMAGHQYSQTPRLPDELLLRIMELSVDADSGSLRFNTSLLRACKKWNEIGQSVIWRDVLVGNAGMLLLLNVTLPSYRLTGQGLSRLRTLTVTAWPWVLSRLSRYTLAMEHLQHLSVTDMTYRYPHHPDSGELAGEGLHDLLTALPPNLQSLELFLHGIYPGEYSRPICVSLMRAMRKLRGLRIVAARGQTTDALATLAHDWAGQFSNLEQLSIIISQYPKHASSPAAIMRVGIMEDIAKRIATAKSENRFPRLKLCRISTYDFHSGEFGKWVSNEHGKNTVHVFDPIRNVTINSPLVRLREGVGSRLIWTQHITYNQLNGPCRAVRHDGWQNDLPESHRPGARLFAAIGTIEDLMNVWDGYQWVTTEQGVRVPQFAPEGLLDSRGLSVMPTNSTHWYMLNRQLVNDPDALRFLHEHEAKLELKFVPDVYALTKSEDD